VIGRYWAMDRDRRWERTQRAYDLLVHGQAPYTAASGEQAVRDAYERGETDEFIEPTLVGEPAAIGAGDSVIAFNFRPDRMRQLTRALAERDFAQAPDPGAGPPDGRLPGWSGRGGAEPIAHYTTLTEYEQGWPYSRPSTRRRRLERCSRAPACSNCMWPRPRSTRT
jgi:2,3-bisphosphoglycerate-independent phosphoglycerate mutase